MYERMAKLVERLHEKTEAGALMWEKTPSGDGFQTSFPNYTVEVERDSGTTWFYIYNEEGDVLDSIDNKTLREFPSQKSKLDELYAMARRIALRSDQAIENLISALED